MYLSELRLWNFRKFGGDNNIDLARPHLIVPFKNKLNILVGENDSGKTAIIDAIKLVIKTHAIEWIKLEDSDFHNTTDNLRIELRFDGFKDVEASWFTEWLSWDNTTQRPFLRVIYKARKINDRIIQGDVTAGATDDGRQMSSIARDYLKCTYLKALRDADSELSAHKNSRVSQILQGHNLFAKTPGQDHALETFVQAANQNIDSWFNDSTREVDENGTPIEGTSHKEQLKDKIDTYLKDFIDSNLESELKISDPKVKTILDAISVRVKQNSNLGLGTMNRLYMATELLHLNNGKPGLHLGLIEELEAHLHPQAQMKVMSSLQSRDVQFIMSTHSPNLTSKVRLADKDSVNFIMCHGTDVYPLNPDTTRLKEPDFRFLDTFLDATKSNLFYAKGVILVEGWAEELLIPTLANKFGMDLTTNEVSIVNVGSTAYLRYANIFVRTDGKTLDIPVSVVTDLDVAPQLLSHDEQDEEEDEETIEYAEISSEVENEKKSKIISGADFPADQKVNMYIAPHWTLEWSLFLSTALNTLFMESVSSVHSKTAAFKRKDDLSWKKEEFKQKLIEKLKSRTLDKVAIAQTLVAKINEADQITIEDDDSAYYLVAAIKHACRR